MVENNSISKKENKVKQNKIIALVGMCGAGKTDACEFFKKFGLSYIRLGDVTMDELKKRNLEVNEINERMIRESLRKDYGMEAYAKLTIPKIDVLLEQSDVLVDGLYSWEEYLVMKKKYKNNFFMIAIYASPKTRKQRLSKRKD